jgi:hypothetical protein
MNYRRPLHVLACSFAALSLSACGLFDSKSSSVTATGAQEFDPYSNSWRASHKVVTPGPSEPNAAIAEQQAAAKRDSNALAKAGRAMGNTASAVGRVVKKPLGWLPFGKKDEASVEDTVVE